MTITQRRETPDPLNLEALALLETLQFRNPTQAQIDEGETMVQDLRRKNVNYRNLDTVLSGQSTLSYVIKNYLAIKHRILLKKGNSC
jgi:hypothetical protein